MWEKIKQALFFDKIYKAASDTTKRVDPIDWQDTMYHQPYQNNTRNCEYDNPKNIIQHMKRVFTWFRE